MELLETFRREPVVRNLPGLLDEPHQALELILRHGAAISPRREAFKDEPRLGVAFQLFRTGKEDLLRFLHRGAENRERMQDDAASFGGIGGVGEFVEQRHAEVNRARLQTDRGGILIRLFGADTLQNLLAIGEQGKLRPFVAHEMPLQLGDDPVVAGNEEIVVRLWSGPLS